MWAGVTLLRQRLSSHGQDGMGSSMSGGVEGRTRSPVEVGIEDIEPGHWITWVFAVPGSYGSGRTEEEALANVPRALSEGTGSVVTAESIVVAERWRAAPAEDNPDFLVNALFDDDRRPLTAVEVDEGTRRLKQNRERLTAVLTGQVLTEEILGILRHLAQAEHWYLKELDLAPADEELPADPHERLARVRDWLIVSVPRLAGEQLYANRSGEGWTPRKLLRRAIWHERDHIQHIEQLLSHR